MIKIKILNPTKDRNEPTFRPFMFVQDLLRDYSIEFTDSDDFDYMFVGMSDFMDKKRTLEDSVNYGLENLSKITGDYFIFDGSEKLTVFLIHGPLVDLIVDHPSQFVFLVALKK